MNIVVISHILSIPGVRKTNDFIFQLYTTYRLHFPEDRVLILAPVNLSWNPFRYFNKGSLRQKLGGQYTLNIKGFSVEKGDTKEADKAVKKVTALLKDKDWKRLIYLKDDEEVMSVSTKYDGDDLVGLMMIAYEPGEEVMFANVVGDLDLPAIMALVGAMDGDELDDLLEGLDDMDSVHVHVDDD